MTLVPPPKPQDLDSIVNDLDRLDLAIRKLENLDVEHTLQLIDNKVKFLEELVNKCEGT